MPNLAKLWPNRPIWAPKFGTPKPLYRCQIGAAGNPDNRGKLSEGDGHNKGYFAINLKIDAFNSQIYLFPVIAIKIRLHKIKDDFLLISDEIKADLR